MSYFPTNTKTLAATRLLILAASTLLLSAVAAHAAGGGSLYLSEEVTDYRDYGKNLNGHNSTITEKLEDRIFPENVERKKKLAERDPLDPAEIELPARKHIFGREKFLRPGPVGDGFTLKTGATWSPSFTAYGTFRTALQAYNSTIDNHELANRLDIFGNLALSGTERVLIGFRPFDDEGDFTGFRLPGSTRRSRVVDGRNITPHILFFEGDLGEIFPNWDLDDSRSLDYQFSLGRQPLRFQDGIMVNDIVDGIGFTRHNMLTFGASAHKMTAFWGFNEVHRGNNQRDTHAHMFLLSNWFDYSKYTIELETAYVASNRFGGDGAYAGIGLLSSHGYWNSTFRANFSLAIDEETPAVSDGMIFTHELSRTMRHSDDIFYVNTYLGVDNYTSAARGPATGGPLGRLGFLNRAVGLGTYGAPLGNQTGDIFGFAFGYQHFIDPQAYKSILVELGGRDSYGGNTAPGMLGIGLRYQQALTRQVLLVVDGAATVDEDGEVSHGGRAELQVKF